MALKFNLATAKKSTTPPSSSSTMAGASRCRPQAKTVRTRTRTRTRVWRQPQPNPSPSPRASSSLLPSRPSQPRSLAPPPALAGARHPTHACGDASSEAAGSGGGHRAEEAGSQRAQRVRRLSARYCRLAGARPRARPASVELAVLRREGDSRRGYTTGRGHIAWCRARQPRQLQQL